MKFMILTSLVAALMECSAALAQSSDSADRVQAYLTSGQAASAVRYAALGDAYLGEKKFQLAAEAFEHASELAPLKCVYWNKLATAYTALEQRDKALDELKKNEVVAAPHATWIDWYNLGTAYDKLQTYEKAVTAYNRALELNPRSATVWTSLGSAEQALGRGE